MYAFAVTAHSLLRWVVIALGILAAVSMLQPGGRRRILPFVIALDLQIVVGFLLWVWLSPFASLKSELLAEPQVRHFTIAHPAVALAAALMAHTGNVFLKRGLPQARMLLWLALAASVMAVPWDRPLWRP